jgi:hypothetical protein
MYKFNMNDKVGTCVFIAHRDSKQYDCKDGTKTFRRQGLFRCSCGNEFIANTADVARRKTQSCGCLLKKIATFNLPKREDLIKHGHAGATNKSKEYATWSRIRHRCNNPTAIFYEYYGGRGITVCERWNNKETGFLDFLADMGNPPSADHSLDRMDNSKGYSPDNCRWVTMKEQNRNKRSNVMITRGDRTMCLTDWAIEAGFCPYTVRNRIVNYKWDIERALTTPIKTYKKKQIE